MIRQCSQFGHNCEKNLSKTIQRYSQIRLHFDAGFPAGYGTRIQQSVEYLLNIKHGIKKLFNVGLSADLIDFNDNVLMPFLLVVCRIIATR